MSIPRARITISDDFEMAIARVGLSKVELARQANISRQAIFRAQSPDVYDGSGLRAVTAWKLAHVYAKLAGVSGEVAFNTLFKVETQSAPETVPA